MANQFVFHQSVWHAGFECVCLGKVLDDGGCLLLGCFKFFEILMVVSIETPNNAVMPQCSVALTVLVLTIRSECN